MILSIHACFIILSIINGVLVLIDCIRGSPARLGESSQESGGNDQERERDLNKDGSYFKGIMSLLMWSSVKYE